MYCCKKVRVGSHACQSEYFAHKHKHTIRKWKVKSMSCIHKFQKLLDLNEAIALSRRGEWGSAKVKNKGIKQEQSDVSVVRARGRRHARLHTRNKCVIGDCELFRDTCVYV